MRSPPHDSDDDFEQIVMKPRPRAPFELVSPPPSEPNTPSVANSPTSPQAALQASGAMDTDTSPSRSRSFLNLTSSTLFGIYQPSGYNTERDESSATPWGFGSQTPLSRRTSLDMSHVNRKLKSNGTTAFRSRDNARASQRFQRRARKGFTTYYLPLIGRTLALFAVGVLYGLLITQLHERREIAPTRVPINRSSWSYLTWWGIGGIVLGEALPWADTLWVSDEDEEESERNNQGARQQQERRRSLGLDGWINIVRSIGAFVGVAFAIRKLPWQSTLQLSLTLALANPAIWFIVDRSPPGFVLSTAFALMGTVVLLGMNPALMPSPSPAEVLRAHVLRNGGLKTKIADSLGDDELILGIFTQDSVGVATWIASVLFVSSVCFGNIGRRLSSSQL